MKSLLFHLPAPLLYVLAVTVVMFHEPSTVHGRNPVIGGLPEYGIRDCHVALSDGLYYMVGTEIPAPGKAKEGISLYVSRNLKNWRKTSVLIDRKDIPQESWYRDGFDAPEIQKIGGRYVLSFGGRNDAVNPYAVTGIAIAVSDSPEGPYRVITHTPLVRGNRFTLWEDAGSGEVYAYWERDGNLYGARMDESLTCFSGEAVTLAQPRQFRWDDRFLDSPSVVEKDGTIYLFYTVFKGGYYAAYLKLESPLGPCTPAPDILFYRSEDQAPTVLRGRYSNKWEFAPPCEIIGNIQIFEGRRGLWYIAYHSEDKYSEPFLCIDRVRAIDDGFTCKITLK